GSDQSQNSGSPSGGGQSGGKPSTARSAQLASRDLQQALQKLEQGRREGMAGSFDDLARRAQQMLEQQKHGENELLSAFSGSNAQGSQPGSAVGGAGRRGGLSWERAEALAEQKRSLQAQLDELQRDMQASAQQHKDDAPEATKKLSSAAS